MSDIMGEVQQNINANEINANQQVEEQKFHQTNTEIDYASVQLEENLPVNVAVNKNGSLLIMSDSELKKKMLKTQFREASILRKKPDIAVDDNAFHSIKATKRDMARIDHLLKKGNIKVDKDYFKLQAMQERNQAHVFLNDEKFSGDSKLMEAVKNSVLNIENAFATMRGAGEGHDGALNNRQIKQMQKYYVDAIEACHNYCKNRNPWFEAGKRRLAAVKDILANLEKEAAEIEVGKQLLWSGVFSGDEACDFSTLIYNARFQMQMGLQKNRQEIFKSKKAKQEKTVKTKNDKVALSKELKPFIDMLKTEKNPSELIKKATDKSMADLKALVSALREIPAGRYFAKDMYIGGTNIMLISTDDNELSVRIGDSEMKLLGTADEIVGYLEDDMVKHSDVFGQDCVNDAIFHYRNKDFKNLKEIVSGDVINARQLMTHIILKSEKIKPELLYNVPTYELVDLADKINKKEIESSKVLERINFYQGGDNNEVALTAEDKEITRILANEDKDIKAAKVAGVINNKSNVDLILSIKEKEEEAKKAEEEKLLEEREKELMDKYASMSPEDQPMWYKTYQEGVKTNDQFKITMAKGMQFFAGDRVSVTNEEVENRYNQSIADSMTDIITEFVSDFMFSANNWDENGKVVDPVDRIRQVFVKHAYTIVYLMDNPSILLTVFDNLAISSMLSDEDSKNMKETFNTFINDTLGTVRTIVGVANWFLSYEVKANLIIKGINSGLLDKTIKEKDEELSELIQKNFTKISDKMIVEQTESLFGKAEKSHMDMSRTAEQNAHATENINSLMAKSKARAEELFKDKNLHVSRALSGDIDLVERYMTLKELLKLASDAKAKAEGGNDEDEVERLNLMLESINEMISSTDRAIEETPVLFEEDMNKDASCRTATDTGKFRRLYENDKLIVVGSKLNIFKFYFNKLISLMKNEEKLDEKTKKIEIDNTVDKMIEEAGKFISENTSALWQGFKSKDYYNKSRTIEDLVSTFNEKMNELVLYNQAYENYEKLIEYGHGQMSLTKQEMEEVEIEESTKQIVVPERTEEQKNWTDEEMLKFAKKQSLDEAIKTKKDKKADEYRKKLFECYTVNTFASMMSNSYNPIINIAIKFQGVKDVADLKLESWFTDENNYGPEFKAAIEKLIKTDWKTPEFKFAQAEVLRLYTIIAKNRMEIAKNAIGGAEEKKGARKLTQAEEDIVLEATQKKDLMSGDGVGAFYKNIFENYFSRISNMDKRAMLASLVRTKKTHKLKIDGTVDKNADRGAVLGGIFKGCGPLLQKILQALPANTTPELKQALSDVKSKLAPLPDDYVEAQLAALVDNSNGKVTKIVKVKSLGAASVGQAFFCKAYGPGLGDDGKTVVVKILRPDIQNKMKREEQIMLDAAQATNDGMVATYQGQMESIRREMDLRIEAENIEKGQVYSKGSVLEKKVEEFDDVKSVKIDKLFKSTQNALVLELADGNTVEDYVNTTEEFRTELGTKNFLVKRDASGKLVARVDYKENPADLADIEKINQLHGQAVDKLAEMRKRQEHLVKVADKWIYEALFGSGYYHGDLHAGNIMVSENEATVIDFGNATQLTKEEQSQILKFMAAGTMNDAANMEDAFVSLLSAEGKAKLAESREDLSKMIKKVAEMGSMDSAMSRIAIVMTKAQKLGFEVPASIFNFVQCMLRLKNTVDEMNKAVNQMDDDVDSITSIRKTIKIKSDINPINPDQKTLFSDKEGLKLNSDYRDETRMLSQSYGVVDEKEFMKALRDTNHRQDFLDTYMLGINEDVDYLKGIANKIQSPTSGVAGKIRTKKGRDKVDAKNTSHRIKLANYMPSLFSRAKLFLTNEELERKKSLWEELKGLENDKFITRKAEFISLIDSLVNKDELEAPLKKLFADQDNKKLSKAQKEKKEKEFFILYKSTIQSRANEKYDTLKELSEQLDKTEEKDIKSIDEAMTPLFKEKGGADLEAAYNAYRAAQSKNEGVAEAKQKLTDIFCQISSRKVKTVLSRWVKGEKVSLSYKGQDGIEDSIGKVLSARKWDIPKNIGYFRTIKYGAQFGYRILFGEDDPIGKIKADDEMVKYSGTADQFKEQNDDEE